MRLNLIGPFLKNSPYGTEIAFSKGLRELGVDTVEIDPNYWGAKSLDLKADGTLVFKSCLGHEEELKRLNGPVAVYQPDDARFPHIQLLISEMRKYADLFLGFNQGACDFAGLNCGYLATEVLPLTADESLYCPSREKIDRDIDVSFVGNFSNQHAHASRREMLYHVDSLRSLGFNVVILNTLDIQTVVDVYRRSKIVINHATDVGQGFGRGYGIQCRHFEVGMTGSPILSNMVLDDDHGLRFFRFSSLDELMQAIGAMRMMKSDEIGSEYREQIMRAHRPIHRAQQIVNFFRRNL